jgi:hypothetical protein
MKKNARLFYCACCHQPTMICGYCDRGNRYCDSECSQLSRKRALVAAGRRYQNTRQGKLKHAIRQRRYRLRQKESAYAKASTDKKVTHQGSLILSDDGLLPPELQAMPFAKTLIESGYCHFCGKSCSEFVRIEFMRSRTNYKTRQTSFWPQGP